MNLPNPCKGASNLLALCVVVLLAFMISCSTLPRIVPDMARAPSTPVQLDGAHGPLSAERSKAILDRLKSSGAETDIFDVHLAIEEAIAGSPLTEGNKVDLLQDGPSTYQSMIKAMEAARDHINMETYIFDDDEVGQRFADALIARQQQGVQVNLIRDSVGTLGTSAEFFSRLSEAGVKVLEYNPVNPVTAKAGWDVNQRDHRKLLIVDGRIAFLGGINISSVYSGARSALTRRPGPVAIYPGATPTCVSRGPWWRNCRNCSSKPGLPRKANHSRPGGTFHPLNARAARWCAPLAVRQMNRSA